MKFVNTLLAVGVAGFLMAGKAKAPATEKECMTPKSKKAGWVWENGACAQKKDQAAAAAPAGEKAEGEVAAPEEATK